MNDSMRPHQSVFLLASLLTVWGVADPQMNGGPLILAVAMALWGVCLYITRDAPAVCSGGIEDHDVL
jgi:hypothetical protein